MRRWNSSTYRRRQQALVHLEELPEIAATEWGKRRAERAEELRQAQHRHELAEIKRLTEVNLAEAALVDAQQALRAQRDYGFTTYKLAWRKKYVEMLDVELGAAERLAILRQHVTGLHQNDAGDDEIDEALYETRAELLAEGLDTSRLDAVIERRKAPK